MLLADATEALDATLAISIGPLPFTPGQRFLWTLAIDGESRDEWQVSFSTRSKR